MPLFTTLALFLLTAVAEIMGCYLVLHWAKRGGNVWMLAGAALSLGLFAWLYLHHRWPEVGRTATVERP